jgi:hypothetical protein
MQRNLDGQNPHLSKYTAEACLLVHALSTLSPDRFLLIEGGHLGGMEMDNSIHDALAGKIDPWNVKVELRGSYTSQCLAGERRMICRVLNIPFQNAKLVPKESIDATGGFIGGISPHTKYPYESELAEQRGKVASGEMSEDDYRKWLKTRIRNYRVSSRRSAFMGSDIIYHFTLNAIKTYLDLPGHFDETYGSFSVSEFPSRLGTSRDPESRSTLKDPLVLCDRVDDLADIALFIQNPLQRFTPYTSLNPGLEYDLTAGKPWEATEKQLLEYRHRMVEALVGRKLKPDEVDDGIREFLSMAERYTSSTTHLQTMRGENEDQQALVAEFWAQVDSYSDHESRKPITFADFTGRLTEDELTSFQSSLRKYSSIRQDICSKSRDEYVWSDEGAFESATSEYAFTHMFHDYMGPQLDFMKSLPDPVRTKLFQFYAEKHRLGGFLANALDLGDGFSESGSTITSAEILEERGGVLLGFEDGHSQRRVLVTSNPLLRKDLDEIGREKGLTFLEPQSFNYLLYSDTTTSGVPVITSLTVAES